MSGDDGRLSVRRTGKDRRVGTDDRSIAERQLIGERRSGVNRRSGNDRRLESGAHDSNTTVVRSNQAPRP
jgi:hypothetical protein